MGLVGGVVLAAGVGSAATPQPNIVFCFADDWGRHAGCYAALDDRPTINELLKNAGHRPSRARGGSVPKCLRTRAELHTLPQCFVVGPLFLANGPRCDFAGGGMGSFDSLLSTAVARSGIPHRSDVQGVVARTPNDAPYGGPQHEYERAGRGAGTINSRRMPPGS